jgi:hypothetical protein
VNDTERFAGAPGDWAFFNFRHKLPPYDSINPSALCSVG